VQMKYDHRAKKCATHAASSRSNRRRGRRWRQWLRDVSGDWRRTPPEYLMKSAIAHLNAVDALTVLTPAEEVEPQTWAIFFEELHYYREAMEEEANRLLAL
jgi:hypothetical protein